MERSILGEQVEYTVAAWLLSQGHEVYVTPSCAPYDLLVDGRRLEVKASHLYAPNPSKYPGVYRYQWTVARMGRTHGHTPLTPSEYAQECDDILAACVGQNVLGVLHFVRPEDWPASGKLTTALGGATPRQAYRTEEVNLPLISSADLSRIHNAGLHAYCAGTL